jgi:hypothetical protein
MNQVTEIRNVPSKSAITVSYVQHSGMFLTLARSLSKGREDGGRKPLPHAVLNLETSCISGVLRNGIPAPDTSELQYNIASTTPVRLRLFLLSGDFSVPLGLFLISLSLSPSISVTVVFLLFFGHTTAM